MPIAASIVNYFRPLLLLCDYYFYLLTHNVGWRRLAAGTKFEREKSVGSWRLTEADIIRPIDYKHCFFIDNFVLTFVSLRIYKGNILANKITRRMTPM